MSATTQQTEGGCIVAAASLSEGEQAARTEKFNLGHLSKLLNLLREEIGKLNDERTDLECQGWGLRVEHVASLIEVHVSALGEALDIIETATNSLVDGAANEARGPERPLRRRLRRRASTCPRLLR